MSLLSRFYGWLAAIGALVLAVAGAWLLGRRDGAHRARQEAAADAAEEVIHAHEVRDEVDAEVSRLPDAPPQQVATAAPGTAAGELRDDGWVRD